MARCQFFEDLISGLPRRARSFCFDSVRDCFSLSTEATQHENCCVSSSLVRGSSASLVSTAAVGTYLRQHMVEELWSWPTGWIGSTNLTGQVLNLSTAQLPVCEEEKMRWDWPGTERWSWESANTTISLRLLVNFLSCVLAWSSLGTRVCWW